MANLANITFKNGKEIQVKKNIFDRIVKGMNEFEDEKDSVFPFFILESEEDGNFVINLNDVSLISYYN